MFHMLKHPVPEVSVCRAPIPHVLVDFELSVVHNRKKAIRNSQSGISTFPFKDTSSRNSPEIANI